MYYNVIIFVSVMQDLYPVYTSEDYKFPVEIFNNKMIKLIIIVYHFTPSAN